MLTVSHLHPAKIAFQGVSCSRNSRIVKIIKHVGQSLLKHTAGTLEIAENSTSLRGLGNAMAVTVLPSFPSNDEATPIGRCMYHGHLQKQFAEMPSISSFWIMSAPRKTLSLDVHQTPLNYHLRPESLQHRIQLRIPVDGNAPGNQAAMRQLSAEAKHLALPLFDAISTGNQNIRQTVHNANNRGCASLQKGPINNQVLRGR